MWMGKEGMGILFSLNFGQIEKVLPKTGIAAGATSNSFLPLRGMMAMIEYHIPLATMPLG